MTIKQSLKKRPMRGFTLIELLTAMFVVAILASLAAPSFVSLIRTNALTSSTNRFVSAINLARSEAVTRNRPVRICKSSDGASCDNAANWEQGWIVFSDENNNNVPNGDEVIRVFEPLANNQTLRPSDNTLQFIQYRSNGRVQVGSGNYPAAGLTMRLCAADAEAAGDTNRSRSMVFNAAGKVSLAEGTAECP